MKRHIAALMSQETGQALGEYGLLLGLVTMAAVIALGILGIAIGDQFLDFVTQSGGATS